MHVQVEILPRNRTVFGISYVDGVGSFNSVTKSFIEIGIGIGVITLYFIFFKKGN